MKKTTKLLIMGLLAISLLASCKKNENNNGTADGLGFKALTEKGDPSRTHGVNQGENIQVQWTESDQILVDNGTEVRPFELTNGKDSPSGEFYTIDGSTYDFSTGHFYAIYPAANAANEANMVSGATATFHLPASQNYLAGSFAEKAMPMVAYSDNQTLQFKNVLGGIGFPLKGAGIHITKVVVTSNNENEKLWGEFTADCTSGNPIPQHVTGGSNVIELTCDVDLTDEEQVFYIMVPPATMSTGFNVKVYSGTTVLYDKTADWTTSPNNTFMKRSEVKILNDNILITTPLQVTVNSPTWITTNSAKTGASVAGGDFTSLGIIYAKKSDLSNIETDLVLGGTGVTELVNTTSASVVSNMTGLDINTIYYVRAYAKTADRSLGMTYYSDPIPFATRRNYFGTELNGTMPFDYTVAPGRTVRFSAGNLQYRANPSTWRFAEYQYDYIAEGNLNVSPTYDGWIDVFGWGTSGYNHNNACYQPWSNDHNVEDYPKYWAYGNSMKNLYDAKDDGSMQGQADWGYNRISNGGNEEDHWRTLTGGANSEWTYLFSTRSGWRFSAVCVTIHDGEEVNCYLLYPDNFTWPEDIASVIVSYNEKAAYGSNPLTEAQWSLLEEKGTVMLPPSGGRSDLWGRCCYYWTSSKHPEWIRQAHCVDLQSNYMSIEYWHDTYDAYAVRLVRKN